MACLDGERSAGFGANRLQPAARAAHTSSPTSLVIRSAPLSITPRRSLREPRGLTMGGYGRIRGGPAGVRRLMPTPREWPRHNLPAPVTPLIGREYEVANIGELLLGSRSLTLTG